MHVREFVKLRCWIVVAVCTCLPPLAADEPTMAEAAPSPKAEEPWRVPTASLIALDDFPGSEGEETIVGSLEVRDDVSLIVARQRYQIHFGIERRGEEPTLFAEVPQRARTILNRFVMGWSEVRPEEKLGVAWFMYLEDQGGRKLNYSWTHVLVCPLEDLRPASDCRAFEVASTDWSYYYYPEEGNEWVYYKFGAEADEPATISDARILTGDVNEDGYEDLLVWRKRCRPMTPAEVERLFGASKEVWKGEPPECELHFLLSGEEFLVSLYDPAKKQFLDLEERSDLPEPEEALWSSLPNLRWVHIPRERDDQSEAEKP